MKKAHLARRLRQAKGLAEVILVDGRRQIDLVAEDQERHIGELLHLQERLKEKNS